MRVEAIGHTMVPADELVKELDPNHSNGTENANLLAPNGDVSPTLTSDTIDDYLRDIRAIPLLEPEDEIRLGSRVGEGRGAADRLTMKRRKPLATATIDQLEAIIEDATKARDELVRHNLRLVISVAKKYRNRGMPFIDLIQEGNIGLIRAAGKFDIERGVRFATHAVWWIRQAITRSLSNKSRTIRLPVHFRDKLAKELFEKQDELKQTLGRKPTEKELSQSLQWPISKVRHVLSVAQPTLELDSPSYRDESGDTLADIIEDPKPRADVVVGNKNLIQELQDLLDELPANQARILGLRYGWINGETHSLSDIGKRMGLSRERIRQINNEALETLLPLAKERNLQEYLLA